MAMVRGPHPLTPSPSRGEGALDAAISRPSPLGGRGAAAERRGEGALALATSSEFVASGPHPLTPSPSRGEGALDAAISRARLPVSVDTRRLGTVLSRNLRQRQTHTEALLWAELRNARLGVRFRRQQPIGRFVVDFYCAACRLVVEIDGRIHDDQAEADLERQTSIANCGYQFLRFTAGEVQDDLARVLAEILQRISTSSPSPLEGEGDRGGEGAATTPKETQC